MENLREKLIDAIIEYSGDEFESDQDLIDLAKEPDSSLVMRVIDLLEWYHSEYNSKQ